MQKSLKFLKGLAVVSCVGMLLFSFGCFDDPVSDEDSVVIQITSFATMTPGATKQIQGTIEASPAIDEAAITIALTKDGADASTHFETPTINDIEAAEEIDLETNLGLKITPKTTIPTGTYVLSISATAGSANSSDNVTFTVTNTTPPDTLVPKQITLGSWQNPTIGHSLEADSMLVYSNTEAAAISADIDVWYSNEADGSNAFYSPAQAATISHPPKDWAVKNQTQMAFVTADFDAIKKQSEVDALWAAVAAADKKQLLRPTANTVFIIETDKGNTRLVKFISGDGTNTGTAVIKGKK